MHEIKINRTSGQQSCPLTSGLHVCQQQLRGFLKAEYPARL